MSSNIASADRSPSPSSNRGSGRLQQQQQQQQQQHASGIQRWLDIFAAVLRLLLWPLRYLLNWTVELTGSSSELDGLSPHVTSKASQQFVAYLRGLKEKQPNTTQSGEERAVSLSEIWAASGFVAARQEALGKSALVFVYLHSPLHASSEQFCSKCLLQQEMQQWLQRDRVVGLGASIHSAQGAHLAQQLSASSFPFCALLQPKGSGGGSGSAGASNGNNARNNSGTGRPATGSGSSTMALLFRAEGPLLATMSATQLMPYLQQALQQHEIILTEQETRRLLRQQESELRRQQDEEYRQTLAADQERERQQREERELERQRQEEEAAAQLAQERAEQEALEKARELVVAEPDPGTAGCATIRFVLPTGAKLNRRFASSQSIAALRAFLLVHFHENKIGIQRVGLSTNFPKKTYSEEEDNMTLFEAGLAPQAVLMVQDLDA